MKSKLFQRDSILYNKNDKNEFVVKTMHSLCLKNSSVKDLVIMESVCFHLGNHRIVTMQKLLHKGKILTFKISTLMKKI